MADQRLATCLWFDGGAKDAAEFYCALFPDSHVKRIDTGPADYPGGRAGDVLTVSFMLLGSAFMALNGKEKNDFTDAVSFQVFTETQAETDRYWSALTANGGSEMACSWCCDRWGIRWQIIPRVLMEGLEHAEPQVRARVFAAMQEMVKIDHAVIEQAIAGI
ncbi:MAG: VOC family protein [Pseudomonadota bacterium]|nr:VOC family protein [Pseudomonadota bacterium]